jgi:hypothetical protein
MNCLFLGSKKQKKVKKAVVLPVGSKRINLRKSLCGCHYNVRPLPFYGLLPELPSKILR